MKPKRILVTGGAGYIGAVLIPKLLRKGYSVTNLDWYIYGNYVVGKKEGLNLNLTEIKGDLRDRKTTEKALNNIDAVIHLACISNDPSFEMDPELGKSVNNDATLMLYDLAREKGVSRFIYASSSSVYGIKNEKEVTEDLPLTPLTDYSKYKALCEKYLNENKSDKIVTCILRPATVCGYSPRMRFDLTVNLLTIQALVNKEIIVFGGSQERPNIHIQDMTDIYIKLLEYPDEKINGKTYNVGYENYKVLQIAEMVKKTLNNPEIRISVLPTEDLRSYRISSEKIKKELGFKAKHNLEDAISEIKAAYEKGDFENPLINAKYYNIRTMQKLRLA